MAIQAMGTRFELVLVGDDDARVRAAGEAALAEIEDTHRRLTTFEPDSMLNHVNRNAGAGWVRVDSDLFELFEVVDVVHRASGGAFDPTIAPLMEAHGFRGANARSDATAARDRVGWDSVRLDRDNQAIRFERPDLSLDLGGIAKGLGLDLAAGVLRDCGISDALLHGGTSTAVALGAPILPGGARAEGWTIALGPAPDAERLVLTDGALSVSAPTGRTIDNTGHLFDARTGRPVPLDRRAAVLAPTALEADAWSTALAVGDPTLCPPPGIVSVLPTHTPTPSPLTPLRA
tara:strand:- start:25678 stop:26547 length:870 start_codon:yes stop_codon:yes gene_type:complete